jgi:hypothetical protein
LGNPNQQSSNQETGGLVLVAVAVVAAAAAVVVVAAAAVACAFGLVPVCVVRQTFVWRWLYISSWSTGTSMHTKAACLV